MSWKVGLVILLSWGFSSCEPHEEDTMDTEGTARAEMQKIPIQTLDFGFVPSVVYETHAYYEPGTMGVLFHMVHAFLYAVQPNPFPKGEERAT